MRTEFHLDADDEKEILADSLKAINKDFPESQLKIISSLYGRCIIEYNDVEYLLAALVIFFNVKIGFYKAKSFQEGQLEQFKLFTPIEQFIIMAKNIQVDDLPVLAKTNEFILEDLRPILPPAIRKLQTLWEKVINMTPIEGTVKSYKMKEGEEIIFTFQRKLERRGKKMIIGLNEDKERIALEYAVLYNKPFTENKMYIIKCTGKVYSQSKVYASYYTFEIIDADKIEIE